MLKSILYRWIIPTKKDYHDLLSKIDMNVQASVFDTAKKDAHDLLSKIDMNVQASVFDTETPPLCFHLWSIIDHINCRPSKCTGT